MTGSGEARVRPLWAAQELGGDRLAGAVPLSVLLDPAMSGADRRGVAYYLLRAEWVVLTLSLERDVLDGEPTFLSASWRSDGRWFWRDDVAHYVLKYGCRLPADFIEWGAGQGWRPPRLDEPHLRDIGAEVQRQVFGEPV